MAQTKSSDPARGSESHKRRLSSDCRLQLACTKLELLVIADQHAAVILSLPIFLENLFHIKFSLAYDVITAFLVAQW